MHIEFYKFFQNVTSSTLKAQNFYLKDTEFECFLTLIYSSIFGHKLISTGYLTEGGIVKCTEITQSTPKNIIPSPKKNQTTKGIEVIECDNIFEKIQEMAQNYQVDYIEFRGGQPPQMPHVIERAHLYANFTRNFTNIEDVLTSIPRKKRADIRKAYQNQDLEFIENIDVNDFYNLFAKSQHHHGTPIHSKKYYHKLAQNSKFVQIYGIKFQQKLVATCMVFTTGTEFIAYYGAADRYFMKQHVYDLLYYHLMCLSKKKQLIFNFGRSKYDTGSFKYKTLWGFKPQDTSHYMIPISTKKIPDLRANNPEFSRKIQLWRLLPLWLVNLIGPYILRQIG